MKNDFTFTDAQALNDAIYRVQNKHFFSPKGMSSRIIESAGRVLKAFDQNESDLLTKNLLLAFSWAMALANDLDLVVENEIWSHFPCRCPYCGLCPCDGTRLPGEKRRRDMSVFIHADEHRPKSMADFQQMFRGIYPKNTLTRSVSAMVQESIELHSALSRFCATHDYRLFPKVKEELVDVIARSFAILSAMNEDLSALYQEMFSGGCIDCHCKPCTCGYPIAESFSVP